MIIMSNVAHCHSCQIRYSIHATQTLSLLNLFALLQETNAILLSARLLGLSYRMCRRVPGLYSAAAHAGTRDRRQVLWKYLIIGRPIYLFPKYLLLEN